MKRSRSETTKQNKQFVSHMPKPEIRDNLDSREGEEQDTKGDDVTHNEKNVHNKQRKQKH